jgi:hypothetical protein
MAASGSIGRIIELISSSERKQILKNRELVGRLVEAIAHRTVARDFAEILALFPQKREDREKVILQIQELESALRDLIVIKKADNPSMMFFTSREYTEELSYGISVQKLTQVISLCENVRTSLLKNANIKLTLTDFLSSLI